MKNPGIKNCSMLFAVRRICPDGVAVLPTSCMSNYQYAQLQFATCKHKDHVFAFLISPFCISTEQHTQILSRPARRTEEVRKKNARGSSHVRKCVPGPGNPAIFRYRYMTAYHHHCVTSFHNNGPPQRDIEGGLKGRAALFETTGPLTKF